MSDHSSKRDLPSRGRPRRRRQSRERLMRRQLAGVAAATVAFVLLLVWVANRRSAPDPVTIGYSALMSAMEAGRVDSMRVAPGREIQGWFSDVAAGSGTREFRVAYSTGDVAALLSEAQAARVSVSFLEDPPDLWAGLSIALTVGLIALVVVMLQRQSGGIGVEADAGEAAESTLSFEQVAGNSAALADLREIVEFLREPERFAAMGARIPKGLLLEGPAGNRQDPDGPGARRRGRRALLHRERERLHGDLRGPGRAAGQGACSRRRGRPAGPSSSSTRSTRSAGAAAGSRATARTTAR